MGRRKFNQNQNKGKKPQKQKKQNNNKKKSNQRTSQRSNKNPYKSQQNKGLNRGRFPVITAPLTMTNTFKTYNKMTSENVVSFCTLVPTICYNDQAYGVVPVHPMFYAGRPALTASQFATFSVLSARLHYIPVVGTNEGGNLLISGQKRCIPVTNVVGNLGTQLAQMDCSVSPVWMPTISESPSINSNVMQFTSSVCAISMKDIPYNFFLNVPNGPHVMSFWGTLYLEATIEFSDRQQQSAIKLYGASTLFTTSVDGIKGTVVPAGHSSLLVTYSTVPNIGLGELVLIPELETDNTPQKTEFSHNDKVVSSDYDDLNDYGTFKGVFILY